MICQIAPPLARRLAVGRARGQVGWALACSGYTKAAGLTAYDARQVSGAGLEPREWDEENEEVD